LFPAPARKKDSRHRENRMGNLFGKKKTSHQCDELLRLKQQPSSNLRLKVRISVSRLKELMAKADLSKHTPDLAQLILRQVFERKLTARVMAGEGLARSSLK
ncbi:hypothetical protein OWV82_001033, partial [Melia azedarach]